MEDAFIWDRNKTMADSIDLFVNRQSTFIAIGTGHLPLDGGLIDLLQKKGYEVKPIIAPKTRELPEINNFENWVNVAPKEAGFSVKMPAQPEIEEVEKTGKRGRLKLKFFMIETPQDMENHIYSVAITDYSFDKINSLTMTPTELEEFYEESFQGVSSGVNGEIIQRGTIKLDSFELKTIDVKLYANELKIKYVVLLRRNRLFMLQVMAKDSLENNSGLDFFINSFKFEDYNLDENFVTLANKGWETKEWETLVSEEGNFSILMLGKTTGRRNASEGEVPKNSDPLFYMSENFDDDGNELILFVQFEDFPPEDHSDSISTEVLSDFYNNIFLGVVGYDKERILSQKTFKINGYLAQRGEYLISNEGNDVYVNAISFWYKTRHYFIQHGTVGKKSSEEEINNFLNSFKLLKE